MDSKIPLADHLLDVIPCGLISFEITGQVLYSNRTFQDFIGYTAPDITGQKVEKFLTLPGRVFFQTHLVPLLRLQQTVNEIYINFKTKSGEALPMLLNGRLVADDQQFIVHCTCFPLNHRARYEEQLLQEKRNAEMQAESKDQKTRAELELEKEENERHLRQLKDLNQDLLQFQKVISHDMSEQMRKIHLYTEMLFENSEQNYTERQKGYRGIIKTSVLKIRHLFDHLSQFIALTEKNEKPVMTDLNTAVQKAFTNIQHRYPEVPAHLDMEQIPSIKALPTQIETMFLQLVANSFKFRKSNMAPHISIATCILPYNSLEGNLGKYRYQNYLQILYTDNSQGFDKKYSEEAFVLLNRISDDSTGGMGLSFCKKIVNNHHGFISINPAFKDGVQVKIYLPA